MKRASDKAGLIARLMPNGKLAPVSAFDAERLARFPAGAEFNLSPRARRSSRQNRLYWEALGRTVAATGKWPTSEHLHRAIKQSLGYITVNHDLTGKPFIEPDSTAFDAMPPDEFSAFFEKAMALIAEHCGFDPLAFYTEAA